MKLIGLCLAVYLPATGFAAPPTPALGERALREECSALSQAGMRDCLSERAENSQKILREAEGKVAGTLSKWDEDDKYINQAKVTFSASIKAFAKYRDAQCALLTSLSGGGASNAHELRRLACVSELNGKRAEQLRDAVADLPMK